MKWEIPKEDSGTKLLSFLKRHLDTYSSRQLKEAIERGLCQVNQRVERFASTLLGEGDRLVFHVEHLNLNPPSPSQVSQDQILYFDEDILAYNKPAGVASDEIKFIEKIQRLVPGSRLVHRLDKDTTGVLLMARHQRAYASLFEQFKAREVEKKYFAIVDGYPKRSAGVIENHLGKLHRYQGQTVWGKVSKEKGLFAKTSWKLREKGNQASFILCFPETGRTHQIRIHLSGMGHPILGDYQYGKHFICSFFPKRCLLHAAEISFQHPSKKTTVAIQAPIPKDFQEAIRMLFPNMTGEL